jgi:hypothetical protein
MMPTEANFSMPTSWNFRLCRKHHNQIQGKTALIPRQVFALLIVNLFNDCSALAAQKIHQIEK